MEEKNKFNTKEQVIMFLIPVIAMLIYVVHNDNERGKKALDIFILSIAFYIALYVYVYLSYHVLPAKYCWFC
jgi:hypothetical protein